MAILEVLRYDPLYSWSINPIRMAKIQEGQSAALAADVGNPNEKKSVNEPGEADRALTVVNKKLSKTLSVTATVNDLINQATDEKNLAMLFSGMPFPIRRLVCIYLLYHDRLGRICITVKIHISWSLTYNISLNS